MNGNHPWGGDAGSAGRQAPRLDYSIFVATLQAWQLSTATARASAMGSEAGQDADPMQSAPLAQILLGGPDWQQAVLAQQGSFNPVFARAGERW